jgi:hypothetical protein
MLVTFDITDVGRSALGGSMGPEIVQIDGRVIGKEPDGVLVGVSGVRFIGGGTAAWRGEQVRIRPDYVRTTYERRLSKGRTWGLAAAGVGLAAYLVTRSIIGSGSINVPISCDTCSTGVASVRIPLRP